MAAAPAPRLATRAAVAAVAVAASTAEPVVAEPAGDPVVPDGVVPGAIDGPGLGELPGGVLALSGPVRMPLGVAVALPRGAGTEVVAPPREAGTEVVAPPVSFAESPVVAAAPVAAPDVIAAVRVRLAQVLDRAGDWLSSLPANPLSSFFSGALLLVRRSLVPGVAVIPAVSVSNSWVAEGAPGTQTEAVFTVTLGRAYDTEVTVGYATGAVEQSPWEKLAGLLGGPPADAPATAGADYSPVSGVLTFAPGQTTQQVSVAVLGDGLTEAPETFGLTVYATVPSNTVPSGASAAATVPARAAAVSAAAQASTATGVALGSGTATILDATPVPGAVSAGSPNPLSGQVTGKAVFTDPAGRTLSYSVAGTSAGGAGVSINAGSGEFVYNPTRDQRLQAGPKTTDTFVVTVGNGVATATQTITVKVDAGALINGTDTVGTPEVATGAVTGKAGIAATDTLGRTVTFAVPYGATNGNGSRVEINSATGEFTYIPAQAQRQQAGADTTDTFIVTATNGVQTETQTITVAVDPGTPQAGQISLGKPDGVSGSVTGTAGFTDTAGRTLTYSVWPSSAGKGSVNVDAKTGVFTYTPTDAQRQVAVTTPTVDTFTVTVSNGVRTATQTITVPVGTGAGVWVDLGYLRGPVNTIIAYQDGFVVAGANGAVEQWTGGIPQFKGPRHWQLLRDNGWESAVKTMVPYGDGFVVGLDNGAVQQWTGTAWQELHNSGWNSAVKTMIPYGSGFVVGLDNGAVQQWTGTAWQELHNNSWNRSVKTMVPYESGFIVGLGDATFSHGGGAVEQWTGSSWQELHDNGWNTAVNTIMPYGSGFLVGLNNGSVQQWTGTSWQELHNNGWGAPVDTMVPYGDGFVVGLGENRFAYGDVSAAWRGGAGAVEQWTGTSWKELHNTGWHSPVETMTQYGEGFVVVLNNGAAQRWGGTSWQELAQKHEDIVTSLVPYGSGFVIGFQSGLVQYWTGLAP